MIPNRSHSERFHHDVARALRDDRLQSALYDFQHLLGPATAAAYRELPEGLALRRRGHEIRRQAIANLDLLLAELADKIRARGGRVFFASDAAAAVDYCLTVTRRRGVRMAVKGKSMVTEEIGLNAALEAAGIEVNETDLGEYIVQLAGEKPSHIIAPAVHKTRREIGRLFARRLGIPYTTDPPTLTRAARKVLREKFLTAGMGISGCNLACAETGHITTVSNEGNIALSTTLPPVHIAFMGMERIAARLADHDVLLRLLTRGAAAQKMAGYTSYVGGPGAAAGTDGPEEFHLVVVDNGRSAILADPELREILYCLRCAACLNVCPVYAKIGGHAYGSAYSGPVGAVVTPLLVGLEKAADLCQGSTLCGACREACPVDIDLPRLLLVLRARLAAGDSRWGVRPAGGLKKAAFLLWSLIVAKRRRMDAALGIAARFQRLMPGRGGLLRYLPPVAAWTAGRDLPILGSESFVRRWQREKTEEVDADG